MIDRTARNELVTALEAYMNDEIQAFELDDCLCKISSDSRDPAVKLVSETLWGFYDDLKDHKIVVNKAGWNFFYRLILLLRSDTETLVKRTVIWTVTQLVALFFLCLQILFAAGVILSTSDVSLLLNVWLVGGLMSLAIFLFRGKLCRDKDHNLHVKYETYPFNSVIEIIQAARSVPDFHKKKFRPELENRKIRSKKYDRAMYLPLFIMIPFGIMGWIIISPLILFKQIFPIFAQRIDQRVLHDDL
ncbi:MAG: hypothetical protein ACRC2T_05040 [Thermoguttaceae bacterium]